MGTHHVRYELSDGHIDNWLVAGPQRIAVADPPRFQEDDLALQVARAYYTPDAGVAHPPVDNDVLNVGEEALVWNYYACLEDHLIDLSSHASLCGGATCQYLRAWAYAQVRCAAGGAVTLALTSNGPADLWVNGEHIYRHERFDPQFPGRVCVPATLKEGRNHVLLRFEQVPAPQVAPASQIATGGDCAYVLGLRILGLDARTAWVALPTRRSDVAHRQALEQILEAATLDRDIYAGDDLITVRWPADLGHTSKITVRLQSPAGRIYAEAHPTVQASSVVDLLSGAQLLDGPYQVLLMPSIEEYYEGNLRLQRRLDLGVVKGAYAQAPYGSYAERRLEALASAARQGEALYAQIARMALGHWSRVDSAVIQRSIAGIRERREGSEADLLGLLGVLCRHGQEASFPAEGVHPQELGQALEACVLDLRYGTDEPGDDGIGLHAERRPILVHACEILAGQRYAERRFTHSGQTGGWHRAQGERRALAWLQRRGSTGFGEWDAHGALEEDILALVHLADLAESAEVAEMAAVVLDKLFFGVALNSLRGVYGAAQGSTEAPLIKGARAEATAGITRLMWGMGVYNQHIRGAVAMAVADGYELPPIIADIAADAPDEMWSRERQAGAPGEVHKVTYKTPDTMLCSAQDYHPGEPGAREHIWQATLGPDAVVFVTHPACMSEDRAHHANFWRGNRTLPRVAQWRDVLIAIHRLPEDDLLGFTHAYFPTQAFDEHVLRAGWAFARLGQGYLALWAAQGLELVTRGTSAYRELRSYGRENVWLCHMGRAARDGAFAEFQQRVLALDVARDGSGLRCCTLRGESLAFAWEGPLRVNGAEQAITGLKHYDNPYCSADLPVAGLEIHFQDGLLRLFFAAQSG